VVSNLYVRQANMPRLPTSAKRSRSLRVLKLLTLHGWWMDGHIDGHLTGEQQYIFHFSYKNIPVLAATDLCSITETW